MANILLRTPKAAGYARQALLFLLAALPLVAAFAPRALALALPALGLMAYAVCYWTDGRRPAVAARPFFYVLPVLALAGISALWAMDPGLALERTLKMGMVLIPGALLLGVLVRRAPEFFNGFALMLAAGFALAILYNIADLALDGPIYKLLQNMDAEDKFKYSWLNRGIVTVAVTGAATLALLSVRLSVRDLRLAYAAFLGLAFLLVLLTYSQSAHLAMVTMAAAFFLFPAGAGWSWRALAALIGGLILSAPLLTQWLFHTLPPFIGDIDWFRHSYAAPRLEIWDYVSRYALRSPWIGHGIEATRAVEFFDTDEIYQPGVSVLHPHNFAVQIWMEFGLLGAVLACAFTVCLLRDIRALGGLPARIALASFLGCLAVATTGYGLWQGWWLGAFVMVAAYCAIYAKLAPLRKDQKAYPPAFSQSGSLSFSSNSVCAASSSSGTGKARGAR